MAEFTGTGVKDTNQNLAGAGQKGISGGMSLTAMLSLLGIYLNDKDEDIFYPELKLDILNNTQDSLILKINRHLFQDLDEVIKDIALSDEGTFSLKDLSKEIWMCPHGIDGIHVNRHYWCSLRDFKEYQEEDNFRVSRDTQKPIFYVRGNIVHIEPFVKPSDDEAAFADIYFKRPPKKMQLAQQDSNNVNCELSGTMQQILIGLACEDFVDRSPEAARAFDKAMRTIQELNAHVLKTETGLHGRNDLRDHIINHGDDGNARFTLRLEKFPGQ